MAAHSPHLSDGNDVRVLQPELVYDFPGGILGDLQQPHGAREVGSYTEPVNKPASGELPIVTVNVLPPGS